MSVSPSRRLPPARRAPPSPLVGEGGRAKLGRTRGAPAWHRQHSAQHPSTVLALRANPPSPTRGEGKTALLPPPAIAHRPSLPQCQECQALVLHLRY
ncbi:MAG: hypothetical protein E5Y77_17980 [Mesorhizobium sp.]|nr:MAG: hypothetical protein E5Y77_17980 [Mesorhizobium sp.]